MTDTGISPLLRVEDLTVAYRQGGYERDALREISLSLEAGRVDGLVGESGSGKTTLALAIMGYLPPAAVLKHGGIFYRGRDLLQCSDLEMRALWGKEIAYIPQNPGSSLNPSLRVGEQLSEGMRIHQGYTSTEAREATLEFFDKVRLPDPKRVAASYPHQISGGMQQRVMIAMALSSRPSLLILDEPTTNLDVTTQASVLELIKELLAEAGASALYVTHNMGVVAQMCDRVSVLYAGELVEQASRRDLFSQPLHPYTNGLIFSIPEPGEHKSRAPLRFMAGYAPQYSEPDSGCAFRRRCPIALEICEQRPPLTTIPGSRNSRCHRWEEITEEGFIIEWTEGRVEMALETGGDEPPTLSAEKLKVSYRSSSKVGELLSGGPTRRVEAVNGVDFKMASGKTLGLVGESGSGKTTLARAIVGLLEPDAGELRFMGRALPRRLRNRGLETIRKIQMVFQNPHDSLNPHLTIGEALDRPLSRLNQVGGDALEAEVHKLLEMVHLPLDCLNKYPHQLSGGEKQRVAIARAFVSSPALLVADEAVSSLDVSIQAAILNLLNELQEHDGGAYLFISHNLAIVGYFSDIIAIMYLGMLMEVSGAEELYSPPHHPYTEALISAIPRVKETARKAPVLLEGEIPSAGKIPSGCPFYTRCPRYLGELCRSTAPPWRMLPSGKRYRCHIEEADLLRVQASVDSIRGAEN